MMFVIRDPWSVVRVLPSRACFVFSVMLLLLGGCAVMPEYGPEPGVVDPKEELVVRLREDPRDIEAHADLLRLQIRDGDEEGARITVTHAIKHNESDFRAHLLAGQFHRWRADLINAERSLLLSRDLAPQRLEPRVALSGLYNQTYLEEAELEQRRLTLELADPSLRAEFLLDHAWACAQLGRDEEAGESAMALAGDRLARADSRARALLLLAELALRQDDEDETVARLVEARRLTPTEVGLVQYAARLVTVVRNPRALDAIFQGTLDTQDLLELRWAALFGKWMLAVREGDDPLRAEADIWWRRLEAIAPDHPDTLTRRAQLLVLSPDRDTDAREAAEKLERSGVGEVETPSSLEALLRLWRAEDALRLGAPAFTLAETAWLQEHEPDLSSPRFLNLVALFKAREDDDCLAGIDAWIRANRADDMVLSLRWWILLRRGESRLVLDELLGRGEPENNATIWIEAVARFHLYRGG